MILHGVTHKPLHFQRLAHESPSLVLFCFVFFLISNENILLDIKQT